MVCVLRGYSSADGLQVVPMMWCQSARPHSTWERSPNLPPTRSSCSVLEGRKDRANESRALPADLPRVTAGGV